jgi:hypothetical protein
MVMPNSTLSCLNGMSREEKEHAILMSLPKIGSATSIEALARKVGINHKEVTSIVGKLAADGIIFLRGNAVHAHQCVHFDDFAYRETSESGEVRGRDLLAGHGFNLPLTYCILIAKTGQTIKNLLVYQPGRPLRMILDGESVRRINKVR